MGQGGRLCVRVHAAQAGRPRLGTVGISPGGLKGVGYGHCYARPAGPHHEGSQAWCWDEAGHTIYSSACCALAAQRQQSLVSQGIRKWVPVWVALVKLGPRDPGACPT